jgi:small subunit ribosomal protein S2
MKPYIFGVRNRIHVIDIRQTIRGLLLAQKFIRRVVAEGGDVCFVGTKRQARSAIEKSADEVGMPYVTERWLGGTLTNFRTIRERLKRLEELEQLTQSGEIETYSKKMASQLLRERRKIARNLQGIRSMDRLPGCLIVVDVTREDNALREARSLGIPTVCLIDTDGDPDLVDIPIPGNDDSMRSIEVVVRELAAAVRDGKAGRVDRPEGEDTTSAAAPTRRRSTRTQFRSDDAAAAAAEHSTDASEMPVSERPAPVRPAPLPVPGPPKPHAQPAGSVSAQKG